MDTVETVVATLEANGFREIEHPPKRPAIRVGARVCNIGERWDDALREGTATVVKVMRRGTDEHPDSWERDYGRPNVEVVVECDASRMIPGPTAWADYGTVLAEVQPEAVS